VQARKIIFGFRVNRNERRMIEALAARLSRTQSDCVRLIVREAARGLLQDHNNDEGGDEEGVASCQE